MERIIGSVVAERPLVRFLSFIFALPLVAANHPDITGTWTLDSAGPVAMSLTISQKGSLLRISQTSATPGDTRMVETECKTDGRFHPVSGPVGGSVRCKWEGRTLVQEKELPDGLSKVMMRFTVDATGGAATEQLHITGPKSGDSTLVWKR